MSDEAFNNNKEDLQDKELNTLVPSSNENNDKCK